MKIGKKGIMAALLVIMLLGITGCKKDPQELTTGEKLEYLEIEGKKSPVPCKVGDLGKGLNLAKGLGADGGETIAVLEYDGQRAGTVSIANCDVGGKVVDMDSRYDDKWIYCIYLKNTDGVDFDFFGISFSSTKEEIIEILGTPTYELPDNIQYTDSGVSSTTDDADVIAFFFDDNGKMTACMMNAKKGDLK